MAEVCARLALYLPEDLYREALTVAPRTVEGILDSYPLWPNLLPHLPPRLAPAALSAYRDQPSRFQSPIHLGQIAVKLPESQQARLIEESISLTRAITDVNSRTRTFIDLLAYIPDRQRHETVVEAFQTVQAITGSQERATVLSMLAPHLPEDLRNQALTIARRIPFENDRVRALCGLLPYLPTAQQPAIIAEALANARAAEGTERQLAAFRLLLPHLAEQERTAVLKQALRLLGGIEEKYVRKSAVDSLAEYLSPDVQREGLALVRKIRDEEAGLDLLSRLARALSDRKRARLLVTIVHRYKFYTRKDSLRKLIAAWQASDFSGLESRSETWVTTLQLLSERDRALLIGELTALAPLIVHLGGRAAIGELFLAYRDVSNWWP